MFNHSIKSIIKKILSISILINIEIYARKCADISPKPKKYKVLSSLEIKERLFFLANTYPQYVTLENSQELYGLPAAGNEDDCPFDHDESNNDNGNGNDDIGCKNWILTISSSEHSQSADDENNKYIPEVFLSGCLHGNERVGPTSVIEAAEVMLEAAACEYDIRSNECRDALEKSTGMNDSTRQWLAHLVISRRTIIVPTANALGYYRDEREEDGIDPNRDFPYDLKPKDDDKCMQTIAARTVNEIFRDHIVQIAITFHAGMQAVAYEWGAPTYLEYLSPDDQAQYQIGGAYSRYGGTFKGVKPYPVGTMNDLVYYVRGGMEDWAYAASWDPHRVITCQPHTYGGYESSKTQYDPSTLRMFNTLVEASDDKTPRPSSLGTSQHLFTPNTNDNGHIPRNIRLSFLMIDIVQPYVYIHQVNHQPLPYIFSSHSITNNKDKDDDYNTITLTWSIGGAMTIDDTFLIHGTTQSFDNIPDIQQAINQNQNQNSKSFNTSSDHFHGITQWNDPKSSFDFINDKYSYTTTIDLSSYANGDIIQIHAIAKVDQSWTEQPTKNKMDVGPNLPPQSHIVNGRTNPDWYFQSSSGNSIVQGQLYWLSIPFFVNITTTTTTSSSSSSSSSINEQNNPAYILTNNNDNDDYLLIVFIFIILPAIVYILFMVIANMRKWRVMGYSHKYEQVISDDQNNNKSTNNNDFHYDNDVDDDLEMLEIS